MWPQRQQAHKWRFLERVGTPTVVPNTWFCKTHADVSHTSSEAEVVARGAGTIIEGAQAAVCWARELNMTHPIWKSHDGGRGHGTAVTEPFLLQHYMFQANKVSRFQNTLER